MSFKDDVNLVKKELNTEEQFLEGFVKAERIFKKYKYYFLVTVVAVVIGFVGMGANNYLEDENKKEANVAFNALLENPEDKDAQNVLKSKNDKLFKIATYLNNQKNGKIEDSDIEFIKELVQYQKAIKQNDIKALSEVSVKSDFLLKEMALFNKALLLTQEKKYKDAKQTLTLISKESKVFELVKILNHFLLTKV